jgi:hypothetical protein
MTVEAIDSWGYGPDMSRDLLDRYFTRHSRSDLVGQGWATESTFSAALRDIGAVKGAGAAWLELVAWLCLLDQVAEATRHRDEAPRPGTGFSQVRFERLLKRHGRGIRDQHRDLIWSLRCSLAHNYSLYNDSGSQPIAFVLDLDPDTELAKKWNDAGTTTVRINVTKLTAEADQVVKRVERAQDQGQLLIGTKSEEEFKLRFFIRHGEQPPAEVLQQLRYEPLDSRSPSASAWNPEI